MPEILEKLAPGENCDLTHLAPARFQARAQVALQFLLFIQGLFLRWIEKKGL